MASSVLACAMVLGVLAAASARAGEDPPPAWTLKPTAGSYGQVTLSPFEPLLAVVHNGPQRDRFSALKVFELGASSARWALDACAILGSKRWEDGGCKESIESILWLPNGNLLLSAHVGEGQLLFASNTWVLVDGSGKVLKRSPKRGRACVDSSKRVHEITVNRDEPPFTLQVADLDQVTLRRGKVTYRESVGSRRRPGGKGAEDPVITVGRKKHPLAGWQDCYTKLAYEEEEQYDALLDKKTPRRVVRLDVSAPGRREHDALSHDDYYLSFSNGRGGYDVSGAFNREESVKYQGRVLTPAALILLSGPKMRSFVDTPRFDAYQSAYSQPQYDGSVIVALRRSEMAGLSGFGAAFAMGSSAFYRRGEIVDVLIWKGEGELGSLGTVRSLLGGEWSATRVRVR